MQYAIAPLTQQLKNPNKPHSLCRTEVEHSVVAEYRDADVMAGI